MPLYEIEWVTQYDGSFQQEVDGLEDAVTWLRENKGKCYRTLYDITIRGGTGAVDADELMRRADAGEPLAVPGFVEVEAEVLGIMADVRGEVVSQETIEKVERLRSLINGLLPDFVPLPASKP